MSAFLGRELQLADILSYDKGGTTAKGCLIRKGIHRKVYQMEVARVHEFKQGSGLPVKTPVVDMIEIGAGGGSIAEVDQRGLIRVGPLSAGAAPGPACYGQGGDQPTLTDANLVLGYLDPNFFMGGHMALSLDKAKSQINEKIAKPLGLDLVEAAWGIHEIINEDCARAFRIHASERGVDYRNCSMVAFGGSGPVHALRISRKLKIPRVLFPFGAGVFSAFGLLVSPLSFDSLRSQRIAYDELTPELFEEIFKPLEEEATQLLRQAGVDSKDIQIIRRLDMRYFGQGFEIEISLPGLRDAKALIGKIPDLFMEAYQKRYSISLVEEPLEIVNWKIEAQSKPPEVGGEYRPQKAVNGQNALKGRRFVYFSETSGYIDTPVYDRYYMQPELKLQGPAVVEERESTCIIGPRDKVIVDRHYNLVAEIGKEGHDE
jgi:N-methylhydantoinase A